MRIKTIIIVLLSLMTVLLTTSAAWMRQWLLMGIGFGLGAAWLSLFLLRVRGLNNWLLVAAAIVCGLYVIATIPLPPVSAALCLAVAAWNLAAFYHQRGQFSMVVNLREQENIRLKRLAGTLGVGYALSLAPVIIAVQVRFIILAILALAAIILLGQSLMILRPIKRPDEE